jgi:hypothetical protein
MKIRAIITGVTGMVGEGVLHECLQHPDVESILIINRRTYGLQHPKLKEIIHQDFMDLAPIREKLYGYNACYFCLGVSSIGLNEAEYSRLTYDLTMHVANTLVSKNPGMTFCYVSGSGTDSTGKGKSMWARVKGRTENDLMKLPFKKVYAFRPGFMQPTKGLKNTLKVYNYTGWLFPVLRKTFPSFVSTLAEVGQAMIRVTLKQPEQNIMEVRDIVRIAHA